LTTQLSVWQGDRELARGGDLAELRRRCAAAARAELDREARVAYAPLLNWQRFEVEELPERAAISLEQGALWVYPTLTTRGSKLQVQFEWTAEEAERAWRDGAVRLARRILERQARDLGKSIVASVHLPLSASPYMGSDELVDLLLQLAFRSACFGDADAPRTRAAFDSAVDRGRESLYPRLDEACAMASAWFKEASLVREALEDPRARALTDAADDTRQHLSRLLDPKTLSSATPDWLRQVPRYLKAELRRWQRNAVRGSESASVAHDLKAWRARLQQLEISLAAELRWTPKLDELRFWVEEYRVSLYAQELKTLGPISAPRLTDRAAEIEHWLQR
jgi:ATP-dependent helicase HrpA